MPSANKTENYGLNQWQGNENPKREDFVSDNAAIDMALHNIAQSVPTKLSQLNNDAGLITLSQIPPAPVQSVNNKTGAVTLSAGDVGAAAASHSHTVSAITDFATGVLFTVLTGLSTATNAAITAADTILSALGKLQAQITGHLSDSNAHSSLFMTKLNANGGTIQNYSEVLTTISASTGTQSLNITNGNVFDVTLTGNTTFTFDNPSASGKACSFTLILKQGSTAYSVTWPSSVQWPSATAPTISATNKTSIITFITDNGGTRWYGCAITNLTT